MKIIYETFHNENEKGEWYRQFEVTDDFPVVYGFTDEPIPSELMFPKWDWTNGKWEEDYDKLKLYYVQKLNKQQDETNQALMELTDLVLASGGM